MNYCPNCGEKIENNTKFCVKCGYKLVDDGNNKKNSHNNKKKVLIPIIAAIAVVAIGLAVFLIKNNTNPDYYKLAQQYQDNQEYIKAYNNYLLASEEGIDCENEMNTCMKEIALDTLDKDEDSIKFFNENTDERIKKFLDNMALEVRYYIEGYYSCLKEDYNKGVKLLHQSGILEAYDILGQLYALKGKGMTDKNQLNNFMDSIGDSIFARNSFYQKDQKQITIYCQRLASDSSWHFFVNTPDNNDMVVVNVIKIVDDIQQIVLSVNTQEKTFYLNMSDDFTVLEDPYHIFYSDGSYYFMYPKIGDPMFAVSATDIDVYSNADNTSSIIGQISKGCGIEIFESDGKWLKIFINGKPGYIQNGSSYFLD